MTVKERCPEPGCVNGTITLFTSTRQCRECAGAGFVYKTIPEKESAGEVIIDNTPYKYGVDQAVYSDDGNAIYYSEDTDITW